MIVKRREDDDVFTADLGIIGYAHFINMMMCEAPGKGADEATRRAWHRSPEKKMQDALRPLMDHIEALKHMSNKLDEAAYMEALKGTKPGVEPVDPSTVAPIRRMTILQVGALGWGGVGGVVGKEVAGCVGFGTGRRGMGVGGQG